MIREIVYSDFIEEKPVVRDWIDEHGREVLSSKPVSIPIQLPPSPSSLIELMHRLYKNMNDSEVETFEDADDFDVPDELGIEMRNTPYEVDFDHAGKDTASPEEPPADTHQSEPDQSEPEKVKE